MVLAANAIFAGCTALVVGLAGCGTPAPGPTPGESPVPPPLTGPGASATVAGSATPRPQPRPSPSTSTGWTATVYYTAVLEYHSGPAEPVTGCPQLNCTRGHSDLGSYPRDFVEAVKNEGAGKIAAGKYLNWSSDTGYWLDTAARDTDGRALRPFVSAAADGDVLRAGSTFTILHCGRDVAAAVCRRLMAARWTITDEFTPGLGGPRHVDLYIGDETGPDFTDSDWYTTLEGATLAVT
jgi:hypothetical protein